MQESPFVSDFDRVIRGMDPLALAALKQREAACIRALQACRSRSRSDATSALAQFAERQITEEAEWVYDDFLLFTYLCVVVRFAEYKVVVKKLVEFRRQREQGQSIALLQDAERILRTEGFVAESMFTVVIADLLEQPIEDTGVLHSAFREAVRTDHSGRTGALEHAIAVRCHEVVSDLSISSSVPSSVVARHLWRRCRVAGFVVWALLFSAAIVATTWLVCAYLFGDELQVSWAEKVIGLGGLAVVVFVFAKRAAFVSFFSYSVVWVLAGNRARKGMIALNRGIRDRRD